MRPLAHWSSAVLAIALALPSGASAAPAHGAAPAAVQIADGTWILEPPPSARANQTTIYDPVNNSLVMFGGNASGVNLNDTWILTLGGTSSWTQLQTIGPPPPAREYHTAVYDPVRQRMLVFGGVGGSLYNDVWTLSLFGAPLWTHLAITGAPPSGRYYHSAIYDPVRDQMVVYGGYNGSTTLSEVWTLSLGGAPAWTNVTPPLVNPHPITQVGQSAIYDPIHDAMLIVGNDNVPALNDVWWLQLSGTPAWAPDSTTGTPPSTRSGQCAIYDSTFKQMVIFGGFTSGTGFLNDSWILPLQSTGKPAWSSSSPAGPLPGARQYASAVYDPVSARMVVFGGVNTSVLNNEVWAQTFGAGAAWTEITPAWTPPAARCDASAIYDPVRQRMLMFGGTNGTNFNDVYALSLGINPSWTLLTASGTPPSGRGGQSAIYDPVRDRVLFFGGGGSTPYTNELWALTLSGGPAWSQIVPTGTPPSARKYSAAIYDPVRDQMLVFGGVGSGGYGNDVWSLSMAGDPVWSQLSPTGTPPSGRYLTSAIYDPVRDQMLIFGGSSTSGYVNDTWALALASPAWTHLAPGGTLPSARYGHSAIYDPTRDRMIVYGGATASAYLNEAWSLAPGGSPTWAQLAPALTPPLGRHRNCAIYDPNMDRMIVYGGVNASTYFGDLWDLKWAASLAAEPPAPPSHLSLAAAFPNPSAGAISIQFSLPRAGDTSLRIFDVTGREIRTLIEGTMAAGPHSARWDGRTASGVRARAGLYFYELRQGGDRLASRLVLVQ